MSKKKALGRGLSALLSDSPTDDRLEVDALPREDPLCLLHMSQRVE